MLLLRTLFLLGLLVAGCDRRPSPIPSPGGPHLEGGWESSGGGGVACFETPEQAKEYDRGGITDELRKKVRSLEMLESFELKDIATFAAKGRTVKEILASVDSFLETYAPIFRERLRLVEDRIDYAVWEDNRHLPRVNDAKIMRAITDPRCRSIQLAVRYSRSTPGKLPQLRVEVDRWLFENKLDVINQAILILHERLYVMGKEMKHLSSNPLRALVGWLLCDEIHQLRRIYTHDSLMALNVQGRLGTLFGDYYFLFVADPADKPRRIPSTRGQYSRFVSFGSLLKILRERKGKCLDANHYDAQTPKRKEELQFECSTVALNPSEMAKLITDEESFLFMARWYLDYIGAIQTSEHLVVWQRNSPEAMTRLQKSELNKACEALRLRPPPLLKSCVGKGGAVL